jgi:chemotaxis protein histidine kinase CheA
VREHAGNIEVQSEIGAGTRFELSFPEAVAVKRCESTLIEKPTGEPATVLVQAIATTQVVSAQAGKTAVASQNDRLIR